MSTLFARKTAVLALAAALGAAVPALAQPAVDFNPRFMVGEWLYDATGELAGSVYAVTDSGRTVIVQYGSYRTPGRHLVAVQTTDLAVVGGRVTLRTVTADALAGRPAMD